MTSSTFLKRAYGIVFGNFKCFLNLTKNYFYCCLKGLPSIKSPGIFLLIVFFVLSVFACSVPSGNLSLGSEGPNHIRDANPERSSHARDVKNSVWKISNGGSSESQGTVFFIGPKLFVTNFHVLSSLLYPRCRVTIQIKGQTNDSEEGCKKEDEIKNIILSQKDNQAILKVKQVHVLSALYDLALAETESSVNHYLSLGENLPEPEEELFILGYASGFFAELKTTGNISFSESSLFSFPVNQSSFHGVGLPGVSGSPVFNKQKQVVGVISLGTANILSAVTLDNLREFITEKTGLNCSNFVNGEECIRGEVEVLRELATKGIVEAQYELGILYLKGKWLRQDFKQAASWMLRSANQDYALAQQRLAYMYYEGVGLEKNPEQAAEWMLRSANQGYAPAQRDLAYIYREGEGFEKDLEQAVKWMTKSAEQGYAPAQHELGNIYREGEEVEKDLEQAVEWITKSAEQGYAYAQHELGNMYYEGEGLEKNLEQAMEWMAKAAKQGHAQSIIFLQTK